MGFNQPLAEYITKILNKIIPAVVYKSLPEYEFFELLEH